MRWLERTALLALAVVVVVLLVQLRRETASQTVQRRELAGALSREAAYHAALDSAMAAGGDMDRLVDSLTHRVTILRPGVVRLTTAPARPGVPPAVAEMRVPPELTALVTAQAERIHDLEGQLAIARGGWAVADSALALQARTITHLRATGPHWYSRLGLGVGYGYTVTPEGRVVHGWQVQVGVRLWP